MTTGDNDLIPVPEAPLPESTPAPASISPEARAKADELSAMLEREISSLTLAHAREAGAQEPVAVPAGFKLAWVPDYPEGDVVGACICGSWPGGKCLRCPVQNPPAAPVSPAAAPYLGWLYHNEDTGIEWSEQHPVESGEVPDATDVRPATLENLKAELVEAWQMLSEMREERVSPAADSGEERLRKALNLALKYLERFEPGDSRAVSNEFVAMAAVACDCANDDCARIIDEALEAPTPVEGRSIV